MLVCLCVGVTSETVAIAVANGAVTSKQVAAACGAGSNCGRCRRTVRAIIVDGCTSGVADNSSAADMTANSPRSVIASRLSKLSRVASLRRRLESWSCTSS